MASPLPNILLCGACKYEEDDDGTKEPPFACPKCDGSLRICCGTGPRPIAGREHRCRKTVAVSRRGSRCKLHGGNALKGPASPAWKTGETSRYVPGRYLNTYNRSLHDPLAQREMRVQLALMEGMQEEALRRLGTAESGETWSALQGRAEAMKGRLAAIKQAGAEQDAAKAGQIAREVLADLEGSLLPLISTGVREEASRDELVRLFQARARLIRVQQMGEKTVPVETLSVLQARFAAFMTKYIDDPRDLSRLIAELREASLPGWAGADLNPRRVKTIAAVAEG